MVSGIRIFCWGGICVKTCREENGKAQVPQAHVARSGVKCVVRWA